MKKYHNEYYLIQPHSQNDSLRYYDINFYLRKAIRDKDFKQIIRLKKFDANFFLHELEELHEVVEYEFNMNVDEFTELINQYESSNPSINYSYEDSRKRLLFVNKDGTTTTKNEIEK